MKIYSYPNTKTQDQIMVVDLKTVAEIQISIFQEYWKKLSYHVFYKTDEQGE